MTSSVALMVAALYIGVMISSGYLGKKLQGIFLQRFQDAADARRLKTLAGVLMSIAIGLLAFLVFLLVERLTYPRWSHEVAATILLIGLALSLSELKRSESMWYAVAEIAAGAGLAWYALRQISQSDNLVKLLSLVSATYFAARGFDDLLKTRIGRERKKATFDGGSGI